MIISIHAARVGCDDKGVGWVTENWDFNPRSPSGLRPYPRPRNLKLNLFQSTQPEWAATWLVKNMVLRKWISIHAARVGCDRRDKGFAPPKVISIHAARVGCDLLRRRKCGYAFVYFNPRSPSGLRLCSPCRIQQV